MAAQRERLGSRLGFILISAGCAVGLGNVWRFPYIVGQYGGATFILLYLVFLAAFALPIMVMEFAVGRGSQRGIARSFDVLEPAGTKWHWYRWVGLAGNYLLMMFYTTVAGWMLNYIFKSGSGTFVGLDADGVGAVFNDMLADPNQVVLWMVIVVLIGVLCTAVGLQGGVERVTKVMMVALFIFMIILCVNSVMLKGGSAGLEFYLKPDFGKLFAGGAGGFVQVVFAAMGQAFFTLSVGIGSMSIFGSYIGKEHRLAGEGLRIAGLDTLVAILAGLIIFPACFAFGVEPGAGPGLVFVTLPNVFSQMPLGQLWCTLFFLFLSCAALSTVIAVFENIMSFSMDMWGMSRRKAALINGVLLLILSLPCALGFNVLSGVVIPGIGDIQGFEDFILSNNILPLGSLVFLLFCVSKKGWGWKNFLAEVDAGEGVRFPRWLRGWVTYIVPLLVIFVLIMGWIPIVSAWIG